MKRNNIVSECEFKMNRLFNKENGCVSENDRGSFIIGECNNKYFRSCVESEVVELMYVSFGWNARDEIFCNREELQEVITFLLDNAYEAYNSDDMEVYVKPTERKDYLKYKGFHLTRNMVC